MNQQHKEEIKEGAMNHWIEYNRNVAKGIYKGDEWLDEEEEDDCCKTCEQTDIEICYDCGECADPSLPNRCCECEEEEF
tara:strand:- start:42 stop:278 length:237 start_codon:yes stop_codon:yes gene_type:complete